MNTNARKDSRNTSSSRRGRSAKTLIAGLAAIAVIPTGLVVAGASPASAATGDLYFSDGTTNKIGNSNLDGGAVNQSLITGANSPKGLVKTSTNVYWANSGDNTIGRANLNGSSANQSFISAANSPSDITATSTHLYWVNSGDNTIGRANLDGTGVDQDFITGADGPDSIAATSSAVVWTNKNKNSIGRANLDGSGVNQEFIKNADSPLGIATTSTNIYWVNSGSGAIGSAKLDGTVVTQELVKGITAPGPLAATSSYLYWASTSETKIGRANIDGTSINQALISPTNSATGLDAYQVPGKAKPAKKCVTPGKRTIPANTSKRLMKAKCVTTSGARIGVKVNASKRGDVRLYNLTCVTKSGKVTKTKATGNGTRYCKKGSLHIVTADSKAKLRVTWKAPAKGNDAAYKKVKTYKAG